MLFSLLSKYFFFFFRERENQTLGNDWSTLGNISLLKRPLSAPLIVVHLECPAVLLETRVVTVSQLQLSERQVLKYSKESLQAHPCKK